MVRVTKIKLLDRMVLVGPPGVGKTEIISQLARAEAKELGKEFVDVVSVENLSELYERVRKEPNRYYLYMRVAAPSVFPDEITYPVLKANHVELIPFTKLALFTVPDVYGTLFIDEIGNVVNDAQITALFSLIQEKEVSWGVRLSKNVKIVSAMNPPEWSEVTRALPKPLRARLTIVSVDPPTVDEWQEYMERFYGDMWEKATYLYLKTCPDDFIKQPLHDFENYPTPRNWTELALLLNRLKNVDEELIEEVVIGRLGKEVGSKFTALLRTKITEDDLEAIAKEPSRFFTMQLSRQLMAIYMISSMKVEDIIAKFSKLIDEIAVRDRELLVLLIKLMDSKKRLVFAKHRKDLILKVAKELKDIIAG